MKLSPFFVHSIFHSTAFDGMQRWPRHVTHARSSTQRKCHIPPQARSSTDNSTGKRVRSCRYYLTLRTRGLYTTGDFWCDTRHGQGILRRPSYIYDGAWVMDEPHGYGKLSYSDGGEYEGGFDGGSCSRVVFLSRRAAVRLITVDRTREKCKYFKSSRTQN